MSEMKKFNELYLKMAGLERRVSKLEYGQQELNNVVDPQGWIGEAFEHLTEDMDNRFADVEQRLDELNGKIDIILQHLTGMSNNNKE